MQRPGGSWISGTGWPLAVLFCVATACEEPTEELEWRDTECIDCGKAVSYETATAVRWGTGDTIENAKSFATALAKGAACGVARANHTATLVCPDPENCELTGEESERCDIVGTPECTTSPNIVDYDAIQGLDPVLVPIQKGWIAECKVDVLHTRERPCQPKVCEEEVPDEETESGPPLDVGQDQEEEG